MGSKLILPAVRWLARRIAALESGDMDRAVAENAWVPCWDEEHEAWYYWHSTTGETTWEDRRASAGSDTQTTFPKSDEKLRPHMVHLATLLRALVLVSQREGRGPSTVRSARELTTFLLRDTTQNSLSVLCTHYAIVRCLIFLNVNAGAFEDDGTSLGPEDHVDAETAAASVECLYEACLALPRTTRLQLRWGLERDAKLPLARGSQSFSVALALVATPVINGVWEECFDEEGHVYFWNNRTGESRWEEPKATRVPHPWQRCYDQSSGCFYFYSSESGESRWDWPLEDDVLDEDDELVGCVADDGGSEGPCGRDENGKGSESGAACEDDDRMPDGLSGGLPGDGTGAACRAANWPETQPSGTAGSMLRMWLRAAREKAQRDAKNALGNPGLQESDKLSSSKTLLSESKSGIPDVGQSAECTQLQASTDSCVREAKTAVDRPSERAKVVASLLTRGTAKRRVGLGSAGVGLDFGQRQQTRHGARKEQKEPIDCDATTRQTKQREEKEQREQKEQKEQKEGKESTAVESGDAKMTTPRISDGLLRPGRMPPRQEVAPRFRLLGDLPALNSKQLAAASLRRKLEADERRSAMEARRRRRRQKKKVRREQLARSRRPPSGPVPPSTPKVRVSVGESLTRPEVHKGILRAAKRSNVPPRFLCALTRCVLQDPVCSPYGHIFERAAIEQSLERQRLEGRTREENGVQVPDSKCPITGRPLCSVELSTAADLKREIVDWHIAEALRRNRAGEPTDDDLYDF
jgi:hypothetical protein